MQTQQIFGHETNMLSRRQQDVDKMLIAECKANRDDGEAVLALLRKGANPNAEDHKEKNTLHHAVRLNKLKTAKALLKGGAKVDGSRYMVHTPLYDAAEMGHQDMAKLLLNSKAKVGGCGTYILVKKEQLSVYSEKTKITHCLQPLHGAIMCGNPEIVEMLISHGARVDSTDEFGCNALHVVAQCYIDSPSWQEKYLRIAKIILNAGGVKVINERNDEGDTPILLTACRNKVDMLRLLLNKGADFNVRNRLGMTVLGNFLADNNSRDIARELILEGVRLNEEENMSTHIKTKYAKLVKELSHSHPNLFSEGGYGPIKNTSIMHQTENVEPKLSSIYALSNESSKARYQINEQITDNDFRLACFGGIDEVDIAYFMGTKPIMGTEPKQKSKAGTSTSQRR